uniref:Uncharacterized protein n=1 Tax=Cacopsylla melanoneura TaxID=428564 RepID=A0A8D9E9F0_9HEMI
MVFLIFSYKLFNSPGPLPTTTLSFVNQMSYRSSSFSAFPSVVALLVVGVSSSLGRFLLLNLFCSALNGSIGEPLIPIPGLPPRDLDVLSIWMASSKNLYTCDWRSAIMCRMRPEYKAGFG